MYNNNDWNNGYYNNSNFDNNQIITITPKRKKHKFTTYLSLVLITSIITGAAVGGGMYYKFSKELDRQIGDLQKSVALSAKSNTDSVVGTLTSSAAESLKAATLLKTSAGDLTIPEIAKKVGPQLLV